MRIDRLLLDIEAQRDFFSPGGSCFEPNSSAAARNIRRLYDWAQKQQVLAISVMLRVPPGKRGPLAGVPHCVEGTPGEQRISGALLANHINLGLRGSTDLPRNLLEQYQQVIVESRFTNIFQHPRIERLLTELEAETFIVCGAGSAHGILEAVVGLRSRGFKVILVADAILDLEDPDAEMAWLRMTAKSAVPLSTEEVLALPPPQRSKHYASLLDELRKERQVRQHRHKVLTED
jgi:nicotinamidase-related amidase